MKLSYVMDPSIKELGLQSAVVAEMSGLAIRFQDEELEELKREAAIEACALTDEAIAVNPILEGYRYLVRSAGRSLKKFPPAAENLIHQVRRTGQFPRINTAVDSYNIVVSRHYLALGVHDCALIGPAVHFRMSPGGEPFVAVGGGSVKTTQTGDFVYADDRRVLAWLDSKDSDEVKVSLQTTDLIMVIQGTAKTERSYNLAAAKEACSLINRFCGGTYDISAID